jgi:YidC/Oxa1 family membrane protein insertase
MERRVLVAIFLSFLVIYAWQAFFVKPAPKPANVAGSSTAAKSAPPDATSPVATNESKPAESLAQPMASATVVGEKSERDVRIETQDVIAVFTNRGGLLKSWRLKRYEDLNKQPLELIYQSLPTGQPLPFSLRASDPVVTATLNGALYAVTVTASAERAQTEPVDVAFDFKNDAGLQVTKRFHFEPSSYIVAFQANVTASGSAQTPAIQWGAGLGDVEQVSRSAVPTGGLISASGKEQRLPAATIAKQPVYEDTFKFAGIDDHYFLAIALDPGPAKVTFEPLTIPPPPGTQAAPHTLMAYTLQPRDTTKPLKVYVGPKDFDQLAIVDKDLVRAINFGMFSVIVVPLLRSLKWLNSYIGNYGWSIIALTVLINLLILPLRHKSVVSMRKMQEIQPEAKSIQDRYAKLKATDPAKQKMNQELMALYKERGVNPASGCVPMLLPFPILIAFYSLLTTAIELRGAPFMLWIHDLSRPDPYYVTPILMGASQLWQQWLAPAAGMDPAQRKMMLVMPVVFTFLFISYPAGVAVYWLATNLWAIGQQYFTNYLIGPPNVRKVRPPAERRVKRVGSGKTEAAAREN